MSLKKLLPALVAISALVAIFASYMGYFTLFAITKPLTTILVIAIPLLSQNQKYSRYARLVTIALVFCLLGDIFLLKEAYFVLGLGSFLIAHLLFTIGFVSIDGMKKDLLPLMVLGAIGGGYYWFLYPDLGELAVPVLLYFVCILAMCWQGIGLYLWRKETAFLFVAIGAVLFLFSDAIIALNKFKYPFEFAGILILSTYWMAVSLLATSAVLIENVSTD